MRNTDRKTVDDLIKEVEILVYRDVFDQILDADTTDNYDIIQTFKQVFPERYEKTVEEAVKDAMAEGAREETVLMCGFKLPED